MARIMRKEGSIVPRAVTMLPRIPVSYTHLYSMGCHSVSGACKKVVFPDADTCPLHDLCLYNVYPVSYTHLDVYKRQPKIHSAWLAKVRADTWNTQGRNSPAILYMFGICLLYTSRCV